jgi:hypothetical protein
MLTDEEYAERAAQLQAERRRGIELIEAAYREQLHALELLRRSGGPAAAWTAAGPVAVGAPVSAPWTAPAGPAPQATPAPQSLPAIPAAPSPAPPAPPRRSTGEILEDIQQALPRLPEEFTTPELLRLLGYSPHRGTLHRLLAELADQGALRREFRGEGKRLSRYRRLTPAPQEAAGHGDELGGAPEAPAAGDRG